MIRTMITASNTMNQLQNHLDMIGNNLAHVNTHGYKAQQASFKELLYDQFNNDKGDLRAPRQSALGIRYGVGAKLAQTQINWKVGSLQQTDRPLDFALTQAKQYFNVLMPTETGERIVYSRQGAFYVSPLGNGEMMLVNGDGYPIADENGQSITFGEHVQGYRVQDGGTLHVTFKDGTTENINLGITRIDRPNLMEHISGTYVDLPANFEALNVAQTDILTNLQGENRAEIGIQNKVLEVSNVKYEKEMADLINVQRNYQFNARAITLADQMLGLINGIR